MGPNPVELVLLNAPADDEPLSAHEQAAWDADQRRYLAGTPLILDEELLGELGISEADLLGRHKESLREDR
jgi:hypothetical protein